MNSTSEAHKVAEYQFWHARLGHVHDKTLKFAVPEVEIPEKKLICHGCRVLYGIGMYLINVVTFQITHLYRWPSRSQRLQERGK